MHTVQTGTDDLPRKLEVMRVYDRMQAAFPGGQIPATVAVTAPGRHDAADPGRDPRPRAPGRAPRARMNAPADVTVSPDHRVAAVHLPMEGDGTDSAVDVRAVDALRGDVVPRTVGPRRRRPGLRLGHGRRQTKD